MLNTEMLTAYVNTYASLDEDALWDSWTERDLEKLVLDTLNKVGCYAYKLPDKETELILPDLICHYVSENKRQYTTYIELKTPRGRLSKNQTLSFSNLEQYCEVIVVKSIKDFMSFLSTIKQRYNS